MNIRFILPGIAFCSTLLFSCVDDAQKAAIELEEAAEMSFDLKKFEFADNSESSDPALQTTFTIEYPEFSNQLPEEVKDSLNRIFGTFLSGSETPVPEIPDFGALSKEFFAERASVMAEFPNEAPWLMSRSIAVTAKIGNLLSIALTEMSFTGGAHPNSYTLYKVIDLSNGSTVKLFDIIDRSKKVDLDRLRFAALEKEKAGSEPGLDWKSYFFVNSLESGGDFYKNENFMISKDALGFLYNYYEIAPYAFGMTELSIPAADFKALLKADSPYAKYWKVSL